MRASRDARRRRLPPDAGPVGGGGGGALAELFARQGTMMPEIVAGGTRPVLDVPQSASASASASCGAAEWALSRGGAIGPTNFGSAGGGAGAGAGAGGGVGSIAEGGCGGESVIGWSTARGRERVRVRSVRVFCT